MAKDAEKHAKELVLSLKKEKDKARRQQIKLEAELKQQEAAAL